MTCWDCKNDLENEGAIYTIGGTKFYKCKSCYDKEPVLKHFQKCEVYSRIVGYLRPLSQWNPGKTAEFEQRKELVT